MKVLIFPVHSIPLGFGFDLCHALTEFSDLLSLTLRLLMSYIYIWSTYS